MQGDFHSARGRKTALCNVLIADSRPQADSPVPADTLLIAFRFTIQICQTRMSAGEAPARAQSRTRLVARAKYVTHIERGSQNPTDSPFKTKGGCEGKDGAKKRTADESATDMPQQVLFPRAVSRKREQ